MTETYSNIPKPSKDSMEAKGEIRLAMKKC